MHPKQVKKQSREQELAAKYELFVPRPYIPYFINRTTTEKTLKSIIKSAQSSTEITLDTESVNIFRQRNMPAIIQFQLIFSYHSSMVVLVEMQHLHREINPCFNLIQELFNIILSEEKSMFIWGSNEELIPFIKFNVFTSEQIKSMRYCNLQADFKRYWSQHHPHRSSNTTNESCLCEVCLKHGRAHLWGLQESVSKELHEYLPKTLTNERFNIGLDQKLHSNEEYDNEYCQQLSIYAMNDVLSMQKIIYRMKQQHFQFKFHSTLNDIHGQERILDLELISEESEDEIFLSNITSKNQIITTNEPVNNRIEDEQEEVGVVNGKSNQNNEQQTTLTKEEKRKIHNRSCTRKQRARYYRHEIVYHNIDRRFRTRKIKRILRQFNVPYNGVNTSISKRTGRKTLYVGIREPDRLDECKYETRHFFTTDHYNHLERKTYHQHRHRYHRQDYHRYHQHHDRHRYQQHHDRHRYHHQYHHRYYQYHDRYR